MHDQAITWVLQNIPVEPVSPRDFQAFAPHPTRIYVRGAIIQLIARGRIELMPDQKIRRRDAPESQPQSVHPIAS
jgi:hypothetical protein